MHACCDGKIERENADDERRHERRAVAERIHRAGRATRVPVVTHLRQAPLPLRSRLRRDAGEMQPDVR